MYKTLCFTLLVTLGLGPAGCKKKKSDDGKETKPNSAKTKGSTTPVAEAPAGGFPELDCRKTTDLERRGIKKDGQGRIIQCYLARAMTIDGVKCKEEGYRTFLHPSGRLKECQMAPGTTKRFGPLTCKGGIKLHANGAVDTCRFVDKVVKVDGIDCHMSAELYANGKLKSCDTAGSTTIGTVNVGAKSNIILDEQGRLKIASMRKHPYAWKGHRCKYAHFWPSGSVKTCEIAQKLVIDGKEMPLNVTLCYTEAGQETKELSKQGYVCGDLEAETRKVKDLAAKAKKLLR